MSDIQVIWHSSEEDGGPDIGLEFVVPPTLRVWVGEMPNRTFYEYGGSELGLGKNTGWLIAIYNDTKPIGDQVRILGRSVTDRDAAEEIGRLIARGLQP